MKNKLIVSLSLISLLVLPACGAGEASNISSSDQRTMVAQAPRAAQFFKSWKRNVAKTGREALVIENQDLDKDPIKSELDEASDFCIKVKKDQRRLFRSLLNVAAIEVDMPFEEEVYNSFLGLFEKRMFGHRTKVCPMVGAEYDLRYLFISGDGEYNVEVAIKRK